MQDAKMTVQSRKRGAVGHALALLAAFLLALQPMIAAASGASERWVSVPYCSADAGEASSVAPATAAHGDSGFPGGHAQVLLHLVSPMLLVLDHGHAAPALQLAHLQAFAEPTIWSTRGDDAPLASLGDETPSNRGPPCAGLPRT